MDPFDDPAWDRRPTYPRSALAARLVAVMDFERSDRGLVLIRQRTRCLRRFDVHELIQTSEAAAPGGMVGQVAYIGFVEFLVGGVIAEGDDIHAGGRRLGRIAGFDETHLPNHLNIVVRNDAATCGRDLGLALGDPVEVRPQYGAARASPAD